MKKVKVILYKVYVNESGVKALYRFLKGKVEEYIENREKWIEIEEEPIGNLIKTLYEEKAAIDFLFGEASKSLKII